MPRMIVRRREVHISHVEVDADSVEQAIAMVTDGEGEEIKIEYSHIINDPTEWLCEDKDGNYWYYDRQSGAWVIRLPCLY